MTLPTVDELYESCVTRKTTYIIKDTSHLAVGICLKKHVRTDIAIFYHATHPEIGEGEVNGGAGGDRQRGKQEGTVHHQ